MRNREGSHGRGRARSGAPLPKYHQVAETMRERVAQGVWQPGARIPSEAELCSEFGVSRITVRRAVDDLAREGTLRRAQGRGTFVAHPKLEERFVQRAFGIYEDMERRGLRLSTQVLRQDVVPAPSDVATHLGIRQGERVHVIVRLRAVEDEKILVSTTYIPEALCPDLVREDLTSGSLYQLLRRRYGLAIARGERRLEAVAASQWEARLLDIALASPLLRLESVGYLPDGTAFEYSIALQRGDRASVEVVFYTVPRDALASPTTAGPGSVNPSQTDRREPEPGARASVGCGKQEV